MISGAQAVTGGYHDHIFACRFILVLYFPVKNGILDGAFYGPYYSRGGRLNVVIISLPSMGLELTYMVALFKLGHLSLHIFKVLKVTAHFLSILGGDIGLT